MSKYHARNRAALARVIVKAGGQSRLARALGVRRQAVHQWTRIPKRHLEAVAALTGYRMGGLRPDLVERGKGRILAEPPTGDYTRSGGEGEL